MRSRWRRASVAAVCLTSVCTSFACHQGATVAPTHLSADVALAQGETAKAADLIEARKYNEARAALKLALDADPGYGPAHNDLALVYDRLGQPYDAALEYQTAIRLMPRRAEPRNNLGLVLEGAGRFGDALPYYDQAVALDPDNAVYLGNAARCRLRDGHDDEVTRELLMRMIKADNRAEWIDWARMRLIRSAATRPAP